MSDPRSQKSAASLRIASYNLQKCVGMDMRRRPGRNLKAIAALAADVVVLQEADKRLPPRPAALPHDRVERFGWQILPFGQPGGSLGWHGNAMLITPEIEVQETEHLELPGLEPRGAIIADMTTAIGPIRIVGVHLGLLRRYRLLQLTAIRRRLEQLDDLPTVIAGDFNEWGSVAPLDGVLRDLRILDPGPSFPALRPVGHLDRFAVCPAITDQAVGVSGDAEAHIASDHRPVWLDLSLR